MSNIVWRRADGSIRVTHMIIPKKPDVQMVPVLVQPAVYEDREIRLEEGGEVSVENVRVMVSPDVWGEKAVAVYSSEGQRVYYEEGEKAYMDREAARIASTPKGQGLVEVARDVALPSDRTFRNAWTEKSGRIDVDMPRARKIHMGRIREKRNEKLAEKDREYIIADERGRVVDKRAVAADKQALRDLPTTFDLTIAESPEELAVLWPAELE